MQKTEPESPESPEAGPPEETDSGPQVQPPTPPPPPARPPLLHRFFWAGGAAILLLQAFLAFQGLADQFTRGHNGYNNSAFHQAAVNSLRFGVLFPAQYLTARTPPQAGDLYTHHPLGMHLHNLAAHAIFGNTEAATRFVPAVHGILAVLALLLVVRRLWGPGTALVAAAVYVALPINGIYVNMMNHSSGFIFYSLLGLCCYVVYQEERARLARGSVATWGRWYAGLLLATFAATAWDWTAYYVAAGIGLHWLVVAVVRQVRARRPPWRPSPEFALLFGWGLLVVACLALHLLLVRLAVGGWSELTGSAAARQNVDWPRFSYTLRVIPPLMFTWTILVVGALWVLWTAVRLVRGLGRHRDLIPVPYLAGGLVHFFVFKWSTIVHEYWLWTTLPFFAIATGDLLVETSRWLRKQVPRLLGRLRSPALRERIALGVAALVFTALIPLAFRSIDLVPKGRSVGGSLWFVAGSRPGPNQKYDSGRPELRFAEQVRRWTDRSTGVLLHESIDRMQPECRFEVTLDRDLQRVKSARTEDLTWPDRVGITGWVLAAAAKSIPARSRVELASMHPYYQWGDYVMVNLRADARDVRIWNLEPQPYDAAWWFWRSAFEPPVKAVRDAKAEADLLRQLEAADRAAVSPVPQPPSANRRPASPFSDKPRAPALGPGLPPIARPPMPPQEGLQ